MANITPTVALNSPPNGPFASLVLTWAAMANGDVGLTPQDTTLYTDVSFQVTGTFGAGGSVAVEGSNDSVNFAALRDPQGVTIALTAASIKAVLEAARLIRPRVTAGDGTTALTVTGYYRRTI